MTNQPADPKTLRAKILATIESGKIVMRPRWHFVLHGILLIVGTILAAAIVIYLASFAVFNLHNTGAWFVPGFGFRGLRVFVMSLPWLIILLSLVFIALLEILVNKYSFAYRKPLLYSVMGVVLFAVLGSFAISQTSFHRLLHEQARRQGLLFGGGLYRNYDRRLKSVTMGEITQFTTNQFRIRDLRSDDEFEVFIDDDTNRPQDLQISDRVVIFGNRATSTIHAEGIRRIAPGNFRPPRRFPMRFPPGQFEIN